MSKSAQAALSLDKNERIPPRARLLAAAGELFYHHGIRAVGVEAIAEAAGTNKMTLYRHFPSKDELVAEYLRQEAHKADAYWDQLEAAHPGDPLAQIRAWVKAMAAHVADCKERGCALANAAVELPDKDHPAGGGGAGRPPGAHERSRHRVPPARLRAAGPRHPTSSLPAQAGNPVHTAVS